MDIADLERMHRTWSNFANEGLLTLGMASRSVSTSPRGAVSMQALHRDWEAARRLKLPITLHTGGPGILEVLEREGLLGPDVQLINTSAWDDADRARIVKSGSHVSITPHSEMRYSYALPRFLELLKLGLKVSLAMDTLGRRGHQRHVLGDAADDGHSVRALARSDECHGASGA